MRGDLTIQKCSSRIPRFSLRQEAQASQSFAEAFGSLAGLGSLVSCHFPRPANALPSRGVPRKGAIKPGPRLANLLIQSWTVAAALYTKPTGRKDPHECQASISAEVAIAPCSVWLCCPHPYAIVSQTLNNQTLFYLASFLFSVFEICSLENCPFAWLILPPLAPCLTRDLVHLPRVCDKTRLSESKSL